MQILFFNTPVTLIIDVLAWLVLHLSIGFLSSKIPLSWLKPEKRLFQTFAWEKDGRIYDTLFHVRAWKKLIPNGSALYKGAFSIKNLASNDIAYLQRWLKESVRSEICHYLMIIPGFFFFLWNNVGLGFLMLAYAFLNNLVPIVLQRYNRPRMRKLLAQLERKMQQKGESTVVLCPAGNSF